ncbi:MAG TPA: hypothetical protein VF172_08345 [Nitrososphaera sp.]|jgi:hypothetical protein
MLAGHNPYNDDDNSKMMEAREFVTITFRINNKVIEYFRKESEKRGISMNALVNQILDHYIEWDSYEPRIGMIPFPRTVLKEIFAEMSADQIARLATSVGKNTAIDMAIFMKGRIDVLGFISWLETRMGNSGFEVVHRTDRLDGVHTITIKHDLGGNWSLYLKTLLESVLADVFKKQAEFIISDSMLSISFKG